MAGRLYENSQAPVDRRWYSSRLARPYPEEKQTHMDTFPDLGSLSDQELKDLIQQLTEEEVDISYKRRILHGKIDILRAELVNRLRKKHEGGEDVITGDDVRRLTDILAGRTGDQEPPAASWEGCRERGAALPRLRLRQRGRGELLPALRALPRRRRHPGANADGRADDRHLPGGRDRRAHPDRPRRRRPARAGPGHTRGRRPRGGELPARRRPHDDRPPAGLRHLPRRRHRLARPRIARTPRRRPVPRRPRLAQRVLRQPAAHRVAPPGGRRRAADRQVQAHVPPEVSVADIELPEVDEGAPRGKSMTIGAVCKALAQEFPDIS